MDTSTILLNSDEIAGDLFLLWSRGLCRSKDNLYVKDLKLRSRLSDLFPVKEAYNIRAEHKILDIGEGIYGYYSNVTYGVVLALWLDTEEYEVGEFCAP